MSSRRFVRDEDLLDVFENVDDSELDDDDDDTDDFETQPSNSSEGSDDSDYVEGSDSATETSDSDSVSSHSFDSDDDLVNPGQHENEQADVPPDNVDPSHALPDASNIVDQPADMQDGVSRYKAIVRHHFDLEIR